MANFLWGVATSAYQIEGAPENDWTEWERLGRLKEREVRCGAATGHRRLWRQDLALLPTIGANAYRYSMEWSRLEPRPGEFDTAALELESERAGFLRARGIEPVVTLLHYTHPAWFWRAGGWENRDSVGWFRRLVERVGAALPDVRMWVTVRGLPGAVEEFIYRDRGGRGLTDTGWEIHPEGFDRVLRSAARAGLPILVTENGIATGDDRLRRSFLHEHTLILAHHLAAGTSIEGYFYWSLLDNFEWLEGFRPRFGLFEVDYATFARRRRPSADLFAALGHKFTGSRRVRAG